MKYAVVAMLVLAVLAILFIAFYLTRPLVIYVSSATLYDEYSKNLSKPRMLSFSYRTKFVDDSNAISNKASLVILDPLAELSEDIDAKTSRWGKHIDGDADISFVVDEERLWKSALVGKSAFLYPEGNLEAEEMLALLGSDITPIAYRGRVTSANYSELADRLKEESISTVLLYEPQSALSMLDYQDALFYVDFRDYAALKDRKNVIGIIPDWDSAIKEALSIDSGDISFDYALSSSH